MAESAEHSFKTAAAVIADARPDQTVNVSEVVNFDGSGSSAYTGGEITSYEWDFGGGTNATGVTTPIDRDCSAIWCWRWV